MSEPRFPGLAVTTVVEVQKLAGYHWRVITPVVVTWRGRGNYLIVPEGYVSDGATVPRLARWALSRTGEKFLSAIVHDALYEDQAGGAGPRLSRGDSDQMFFDLMEVTGVNAFTRGVAYAAVRAAGFAYWRDGE